MGKLKEVGPLVITIENPGDASALRPIYDAIKLLRKKAYELEEENIYQRIGDYFDRNPDVVSLDLSGSAEGQTDDEGNPYTSINILIAVKKVDGEEFDEEGELYDHLNSDVADLCDDERNDNWQNVFKEYEVDSKFMQQYSARSRAIAAKKHLKKASAKASAKKKRAPA